jgi:hypothetical protein
LALSGQNPDRTVDLPENDKYSPIFGVGLSETASRFFKISLFLSGTNYFDNWQTPIGLAVVISLGAVYAWSCAYLLRDTAEHARTDAVHRLKEESMRVLATEPVNQEKMKRIEFVLKEISLLKEGAFAPFTQQPLLQALLVPFGGVGGVFMVDFFSKMNV